MSDRTWYIYVREFDRQAIVAKASKVEAEKVAALLNDELFKRASYCYSVEVKQIADPIEGRAADYQIARLLADWRLIERNHHDEWRLQECPGFAFAAHYAHSILPDHSEKPLKPWHPLVRETLQTTLLSHVLGTDASDALRVGSALTLLAHWGEEANPATGELPSVLDDARVMNLWKAIHDPIQRLAAFAEKHDIDSTEVRGIPNARDVADLKRVAPLIERLKLLQTGPSVGEQFAEIATSQRILLDAERIMANRHGPTSGATRIERPDFYVTTDIRATSDPLWQDLAAFRRRLMEGVAQSPAEWQSQLIDIRLAAHAAGLRPSLGSVEHIVATVSEAREGGTGLLDEEEESWSKVILTACGEAGCIELHDLLDGFADTGIPADKHKRESAIEWAESWMNARERQLCQSAAPSTTQAPVHAIDPMRIERLEAVVAAVLPVTEASGPKRTRTKKPKVKAQTKADRVRAILNMDPPFEGNKAQLAKKVGYRQQSCLRGVKNFGDLWDAHMERVEARRRQSAGRMQRAGE